MSERRPRWNASVWMSVGGVVMVLLIAAVVTLGSLTVPIRIEQGPAWRSSSPCRFSLPRRCWSSA